MTRARRRGPRSPGRAGQNEREALRMWQCVHRGGADDLTI